METVPGGNPTSGTFIWKEGTILLVHDGATRMGYQICRHSKEQPCIGAYKLRVHSWLEEGVWKKSFTIWPCEHWMKDDE